MLNCSTVEVNVYIQPFSTPHPLLRSELRTPRVGVLDLLGRMLRDRDHVGICCGCSGR